MKPHYRGGLDGSAQLVGIRTYAPGYLPVGGSRDADRMGAPYGISGPRVYSVGVRDAATDTLRYLPLERGASRDLVRTNPIAAGAISTNVDHVVGTGLALIAAPDREILGWDAKRQARWKAKVQREFSLFADSMECDIRGEQNFYDLQRLVERSSLESGDCGTVLPDGEATREFPFKLRLQVIEADRIGNPNSVQDSATITAGIKRDEKTGRAIAAHIYHRHPGSPFIGSDRLSGEWVDYRGQKSGRRRFLHHARFLRPEMPRGVPYLSPIAGHLQQLARYTEAEIRAAVVTAMLTVFVETPPTEPVNPLLENVPGDAATVIAPNGDIELGSGSVLGLSPGEKVTVVDPKRPASGFDPFILAIIKQIGVGLGLPFEVLIKVFNSSYSASKAAKLDAWMRFRAERVWLARSFCQPIYEEFLTEAVLSGRISAPGFFDDPLVRWAYCQAGWFGDSPGSINPKEEIEAGILAINNRITTRERVEWEIYGTDWNATFAAKQAEEERLKEADMLPPPVAGAPAPPPKTPKPGAPGSDEAPKAEAAPAQPPNVAVSFAAGAFSFAPPNITIRQGDTTIHTPEQSITFEATMPEPSVTVEGAQVEVHTPPAPPAQVIVQPPAPVATRQTYTYNAAGDIESAETVPIPPPLND